MLAAITVVMLVAGVALIGSGVFLTFKQATVESKEASQGMTGLVKALAELATALQGYPPGLVCIFLGVLLLIASSILGAAGAVTA